MIRMVDSCGPEGTVQHLIHFRELDTDEHSSRTADYCTTVLPFRRLGLVRLSDNKMHLLQQINDPVLLLTAGRPVCVPAVVSTPLAPRCAPRARILDGFLGGTAVNVTPPGFRCRIPRITVTLAFDML